MNGKQLGAHRGGYSAFIFELTAHLKYGRENQLKVVANGIKVEAATNGKTYTDNCVWVLDTAFGAKQMAKIMDAMNFIPHAIIVGLLLLVWLGWKSWGKRRKTTKWKRRVAKTFFFLILLVVLVIIVFQILVRSSMGG